MNQIQTIHKNWQEPILRVVKLNPEIKLEQLARALHISKLIAHQRTNQLIEEGVLVRSSTGGFCVAAQSYVAENASSLARKIVPARQHTPLGQVFSEKLCGKQWVVELLLAIAARYHGEYSYKYVKRGQVEVRRADTTCLMLGWSRRAVFGETRCAGRVCQFMVENTASLSSTTRLILQELGKGLQVSWSELSKAS